MSHNCNHVVIKSYNIAEHNYQIDYPVRIHCEEICNCQRVRSKISLIGMQSDDKIIYIVEKIWNDDEIKEQPQYIFIVGEKTKDDSLSADKILESLFCDKIASRKCVVEYFKRYDWSSNDSTDMRKIIKNMTSICFCAETLRLNKSNCNAGFVIIGTREQTAQIVGLFNKFCQKTEFSKAYMLQLSNIPLIDRNNLYHDLILLNDSDELKQLEPFLYTIVGTRKIGLANCVSDQIYSLPSGKREWFFDITETSFECAKRELYEELNIQFTKRTWKRSCHSNKPQSIYRRGFMLYFLYLNDDISIKYHANSETIVIDTY